MLLRRMQHEKKEVKNNFLSFQEKILPGKEKIRNNAVLLIFQTELLEYSMNKYFKWTQAFSKNELFNHVAMYCCVDSSFGVVKNQSTIGYMDDLINSTHLNGNLIYPLRVLKEILLQR